MSRNKAPKILFTAPFQENYDLLQRRLDVIEEELFPHIQRMLKRLYPELLQLIPSSVEKSLDSLKDKVEDFDDDDFLPGDTKKRVGLLSEALELGMNLANTFIFNIVRVKKGTSEEEFKQATDDNKVWATGFKSLEEYSRMSYESAAMTLHEDARLYIKGALEKGIIYKDMADGLKEVLGWDDGWRAMRIARTESNFAASQGIKNASTQLGITKFKGLLSISACPRCVSKLSERVFDAREIDALFPVHPNCRCVPAAVIPDDWNIEDYL